MSVLILRYARCVSGLPETFKSIALSAIKDVGVV